MHSFAQSNSRTETEIEVCTDIEPIPVITSRRHVLQHIGQSARAFGLAAALQGVCGVVQVAVAQPRNPTTRPAEVLLSIPEAKLIGRARLRFFGLNIYEAVLWANAELRPSVYAASPLALELNYLRNLNGGLIAERSIQEMRRVGPINTTQEQAWLRFMQQTFPNVIEGDRITGVHQPSAAGGAGAPGGAAFFYNGAPVGQIADADFSRYFFGIWLHPNSSEPKMRSELLLGALSA